MSKAEPKNPFPAAKILRVFQLIEALSHRPIKIADLAAAVDMDRRTVYRYLDLLEELNFQIVRGKGTAHIGRDYKPYYVSRLIKIYQ